MTGTPGIGGSDRSLYTPEMKRKNGKECANDPEKKELKCSYLGTTEELDSKPSRAQTWTCPAPSVHCPKSHFLGKRGGSFSLLL